MSKFEAWRSTCGRVTLYRGDCMHVLSDAEFAEIDVIIADPPYSSGGMFRADRQRRSLEKYFSTDSQTGLLPDIVGDSRDQRSWKFWCTMWLSLCHAKAAARAYCFCFSDWRQLPTMTDAMQAAGWVLRGIAVWDKLVARPQSGRPTQQAEFIPWASRGPLHTDYSRPTCRGVLRASPPKAGQRLCQTEKPVCILEALLSLFDRHVVVLDPFCGSASTGVAALRAGQMFVGIEINAEQFQLAKQRLERELCKTALFDGQIKLERIA